MAAAGWAGRGTAPAPLARDSAWAVVEDQAAGPGAEAVARLEVGRVAVPVCGNPVARGAVELVGERVQVAEPERAVVAAVVVELVMAVESVAAGSGAVVAGAVVVAGSAVAAEGPEPAAERPGELKVPGPENG